VSFLQFTAAKTSKDVQYNGLRCLPHNDNLTNFVSTFLISITASNMSTITMTHFEFVKALYKTTVGPFFPDPYITQYTYTNDNVRTLVVLVVALLLRPL